MSRIPIIYFDLDGVLADHNGKVIELLGPEGPNMLPEDRWKLLSKKKYNFFESLDEFSGMEVWNYCQTLSNEKRVLTALPDYWFTLWAEWQKRRWCEKHLGSNIRVITCHHTQKAKYCKPGDILIDDNAKKHSDKWKGAGGTFIHFQNNPDVIIKILKEKGF